MTAVLRNQGIDPATFAASTRELLTEDPFRYRNFGPFWYFVKALLKKFYGQAEMPMLGDYEDASVVARMGPVDGVDDAMIKAAETYAHNASFNLGRPTVEDYDGETFLLHDPDVEG